jgi:hypothetical protein
LQCAGHQDLRSEDSERYVRLVGAV